MSEEENKKKKINDIIEKALAEQNKKMNEEMARTDLNILLNADSMEDIKLVKLKPAVKKKFQFIKKKFKPISARQKYNLKFNTELSKFASAIDFKENRVGLSNYNFIDVFDSSNDNFLFRFKPFNDDKIMFVDPLLDGTFLYRGRKGLQDLNPIFNCKIVSIIENKAYQIHYEFEMNSFKIQLSDERLLDSKHCTLGLYGKDSTGKFQKTLEKEIQNSGTSLSDFHQVRDNLIIATGLNLIYFIEINTLNVIDVLGNEVDYQALGFVAENLCIVKNSNKKRQYALIDINKRKIIDYATESERQGEETKREREKRGLSYDISTKDAIFSMEELPDHSQIVCFKDIVYNEVDYYQVYYDEESGEIIEKGMPKRKDPKTNKVEKIELMGILENGNIYLRIGNDPTSLYK